MIASRIIRLLLLLFFSSLFSACDMDDEKAWSDWGRSQHKTPYRCGMIGPYRLRVNREYLFFWPTYEGRSDWDKNKEPPPSSCDAVISSITLEVYFPSMLPAGRTPIELDPSPEHMSVTIDSVATPNAWDLSQHLKYRLQRDETKIGDIEGPLDGLGLYYYRGVDAVFENSKADYYWQVEEGKVSVLISCGPLKEGITKYCEQIQYAPFANAIVKSKYHAERVEDWKRISDASKKLIINNSKVKE